MCESTSYFFYGRGCGRFAMHHSLEFGGES